MKFTLKGKDFMEKTMRPQIKVIRALLDKQKLGALLDNEEIGKACKITHSTLSGYCSVKFSGKLGLDGYFYVLRDRRKMWGSPATIKALKKMIAKGPQPK